MPPLPSATSRGPVTRTLLFRCLLTLASIAGFVGVASAEQPAVEELAVERVQAVERSTRGEPLPFDPERLRRTDLHLPITGDIPPEPLPVAGPEDESDGEECLPCQREVLQIDLRTREVIERRPAVESELEAVGPTIAGQGDVHAYPQLGQGLALPKDFGDLYLVSNPEFGEYPRHVKIFSEYLDTNGITRYASCSGTLIDPQHVLTAGHCIYKHDGEDDDGNGYDVYDFATKLTIIPGYDEGAMPFGSANSVGLHAYSGWVNDRNRDYDVAVIDLDRNVGALTGWRGFGSTSNCDFFTSPNWSHYSYPAEDGFSGEFMYQDFGDYDGCGNILNFDRPNVGGMSGSGGIRNGVAWSVLTHSVCFIECGGRDTRLQSFMALDMIAWLDQDHPNSLDLMALDTQVYESAVDAGDELLYFNFLVHNYSKATLNDNVSFEIYLSDDQIIDSGDIYVTGGGVALNLAPDQSARVDAIPPTIPADVPPGDYYIGALIDRPDVDNSNNGTHFGESRFLTVECARSSPPAPTAPASGAQCMPLDLTLDWTDAGVGTEYWLTVGSSCGLGESYYTTNSQFTVTDLEPNRQYRWTVRSRTICGNWSDRSVCSWFVTEGPPDPVTVFNSPPDGSICQPLTSTFDWDPVPDCDRYYVQVGLDCGQGNAYLVTGGATQTTISGLDPSSVYHWRVQPRTTCGIWGAWSDCREFSTERAGLRPPALFGPTDGLQCAGPNANLTWAQVVSANAYDVRFGSTCGSGQVFSTSESSYYFPDLASGEYHWEVRVYACGMISDWSECRSFTVDADPPSTPTVTSPSHVAEQWSPDPTVVVDWTAADDACGVDGYQYSFDQDATGFPSLPTATETGQLTATSDPLPDGPNHWFHVVARDVPGNLSPDPGHFGPVRIDTTDPSGGIVYPSGGETLVHGTLATLSWNQDDATSGVQQAGLSYSVDGGGTWLPIDTVTGFGSAKQQTVEYDWAVPDHDEPDCHLRVELVDQAGNGTTLTSNAFVIAPGATDAPPSAGVSEFALEPNSPNPFNPKTTLRYALPRAAEVRLEIFDVQGRCIRTLVDRRLDGPAEYEVDWDGRTDGGMRVSSGVYFYRLEAGDFRQTRRMTLVK